MAGKRHRVPATRERPTKPDASPDGPLFSRWFVALLGVGALVGLVLGGLLISRDGDGGVSGLIQEQDSGPVHVHGLGRNPADGALFIATHTGLFRVAEGESKAERVGESRQDTMGFTVIGPDRFLGSGHPDNFSQPPLLGLIESNDAGRTWDTVSLLGEADFHVLRVAGGRVYGYDASNGRLMVSADAGRTWTERTLPAPLLDLAANPSRLSELVASAEGALYASADGGRSWHRLGDVWGLFAWPRADRLYLVDAAGDVHVSRRQGREWRRVGSVGGQPAAFAAEGDRELYVALHDGTIKRSADSGRSWAIRSAP